MGAGEKRLFVIARFQRVYSRIGNPIDVAGGKIYEKTFIFDHNSGVDYVYRVFIRRL